MRRRLLVLLLVGPPLLAACGGGHLASSTSQLTPDSTTPSGTSLPRAEQGRKGQLLAVPIDEGVVEVRVHRRIVGVGDPVSAVVANGRSHSIFVRNLHTACSVATLQRRLPDGSWESFDDCGSERLPAVLEIGPQHGRTVDIAPASLAEEGQPVSAGTYRLVVAWTVGTSADGAARSTTSRAFEVR